MRQEGVKSHFQNFQSGGLQLICSKLWVQSRLQIRCKASIEQEVYCNMAVFVRPTQMQRGSDQTDRVSAYGLVKIPSVIVFSPHRIPCSQAYCFSRQSVNQVWRLTGVVWFTLAKSSSTESISTSMLPLNEVMRPKSIEQFLKRTICHVLQIWKHL